MKVLHISKYYYPFLGGTEQVARDIVQALLGRDDIEQKIICFNEDASNGNIICKKNETTIDYVDGVEVIRCGYQVKISSQALSMTYGKQMKKLMNDYRPDVIFLHYPNPFVTHYLLKYKDLNFKLYVYWHLDITKQRFLKKFFYSQNVELIKRAHYILGATPKHLNESEFTPIFGEKKRILPYTIDEANLVITDEEIARANVIKKKYDGKKLAFFIGRHVPYKGLKYLIEASQKMKKDNIHILIAGTGELTEELKEQAKNDKKIEFLGRITDSERRSYLYASDIICFPSITRNEGFGLALAEGMYYGKPAVTFTIPGSGVNYVSLDGVTGIECPNRNSTAFAKALDQLCSDNDLLAKYGTAARQRVIDNFTQDRFKNNILALLEE